MRIDATTLATEGLRYASRSAAAGENEVVLGPSGGVTGFYESTPSGHVVDAQAGQLQVRRASLFIGAGALTVESATRLQHVVVKLDVPAGDRNTTLRIGGESVELQKLRYVTASLELDASVLLEGALVERDAAGKLTVVAVAAVLRDVVVKSGATELRLDLVKARKLALVVEGDAVRLAVEGLEVDDLTLVSGDIRLKAAKLDIPRGVSWNEGRIEIADLVLSGLDVAYDLPAAGPEAPEPASKPKKLPDLPALDQIDGQLSVDVRIHAALPLLKERGATHALRIPIDQGAISFGEVEDGFSAVADALLDFELEGDTLKLELDVIPIVKFDNVTLLFWKLIDPVDRELAAQKAIRLRRLLQFERPPSEEAKAAKATKRQDKASIRLLGVDIAPIALSLTARAPVLLPIGTGQVCLDDGEGHAVESFELGGELHLAIEGDSKPGHLHASAKGVVAVVDQAIAAGSVEVLSGSVTIPSVDSIHADFDGARPTRLTGAVPTIRVRGANVLLRPAAAKA